MMISDFLMCCGAFSGALPLYVVTQNEGTACRLSIDHIGHHRPPELIDASVPVELFTPLWGATAAIETPLHLGALVEGLQAYQQDADLRIAVPTDEGHHRVLTIERLGIDFSDGALAVVLDAEPWDSLHKIIRVDAE